jgi:saccharopine dehydrogenase-like NADP-dependent oxidoreductase
MREARRMKITILGGAGLIGAGIARDLASSHTICPLDTINICDVSEEKAQALAAELDDPRLRAAKIDVSHGQSMLAAIAGADLCINAVPTLAGFQMAIFAAALEARVPYMDLGGLGTFTVAQKAWHDQFRAAGVTAVIGTGADPGMSNVLCRVVADRLDTIERINLYWAAELLGAESPVLVPTYNVATLLAEYAQPSTQFLDGRHVEVPAMSGTETIDLPPPWGATRFMYSPHSEPLTVPLAEGIGNKGIREFTWKLHLPERTHEAWVGLVKAGFGRSDEPVIVRGVPVNPVEVLQAVIDRNIAAHRHTIPAQESHEIHFAIGTGTRDGSPRRVRCDVIVRPDPAYAPYADAATSMNASIAAQLILCAPPRPGVWAPEEFFAVEPYLAELRKRRFQVSITDETF